MLNFNKCPFSIYRGHQVFLLDQLILHITTAGFLTGDKSYLAMVNDSLTVKFNWVC